ncbi:MAG: hypothetical protein ACM4D3_09820 [Candidatus Sericytochromatia bacterium]
MTETELPAELRARDPDFIRNVLATLWLAATVWFRAEVDGFENVPDEPVLFVGNHSGGGATPDTFCVPACLQHVFHRRRQTALRVGT